ncbi:MAG: YcfL family protein [Victivallales bacterium]|nr:YcfL family protein [Victivallales bacterium]
MRSMMLAFTACCLLPFLPGCQSTVDTVENREKQMTPDQVDTSRVSTDAFLKGRLKIERVDRSEQPDGLLRVQVTARNVRSGFWSQVGSWFMGDNPYQIAYRFSWLDKDGMEVRTATQTWIPMSVDPGDTVRIRGISPNPRCKDFVLSLKENPVERN